MGDTDKSVYQCSKANNSQTGIDRKKYKIVFSFTHFTCWADAAEILTGVKKIYLLSSNLNDCLHVFYGNNFQ